MGPIAERGLADPVVLVLGCLIWVPIALWILSLLHWMIQGDIDAGFGVIGISIGVALGILSISPPKDSPLVVPAVFTAVILTVALFIPIRNALSTHELVSIDMDAIDRAYRQLDDKPNNVGARFKIAKLVYRRGMQGHGIRIAEEALKSMPPDIFNEEHKLVEGWKRQEYDALAFRALPCIECGLSNPPGELYCRRCGSKFLLDQAKGRWIGRATARKLLACWVALMGVFVGAPIAATALPIEAAALAVAGIVILVLVTLYSAFLGTKLQTSR